MGNQGQIVHRQDCRRQPPTILPLYQGKAVTPTPLKDIFTPIWAGPYLQQIQLRLGFRDATREDFSALADWLLTRALEHDKPSLLFQLVQLVDRGLPRR